MFIILQFKICSNFNLFLLLAYYDLFLLTEDEYRKFFVTFLNKNDKNNKN